VFALNLLIAEAGRLWALRYPESNELWVLSPDRGGATEPGDSPGSVPAVVIASEPMDDHPGWRSLAPGELLVVDGLAENSLFPFEPLRHPLRRSELSVREAASQTTAATPSPSGPVPVGPGPAGADGVPMPAIGAVPVPLDGPAVLADPVLAGPGGA
jgi:glutamine amidotransferase